MSLRFTSVPMQNGQFIWRLHSSENALIARAGTGVETFVSAQRAATAFKSVSSSVQFVVYVNAVGKWRWLACRAHVTLARSGRAFPSGVTAERAGAHVQSTPALLLAPDLHLFCAKPTIEGRVLRARTRRGCPPDPRPRSHLSPTERDRRGPAQLRPVPRVVTWSRRRYVRSPPCARRPSREAVPGGLLTDLVTQRHLRQLP